MNLVGPDASSKTKSPRACLPTARNGCPTRNYFADREIAREVVELTSRESTDRVADAKRKLALTFSDKERVDVALATNMISVGLDITRLGLMVVLGQPKAAAEYIQATSRVGRDADQPGLVVTLLNVHRPRDRSHYERFEVFHAAFYRSVEATSVTPFAARRPRSGSAGRCGVTGAAHPSSAHSAEGCDRTGDRATEPWPGVRDSLGPRPRAPNNEPGRRRAVVSRPSSSGRLTSSIRGPKLRSGSSEAGARLVYQRHENADGPVLLHEPLDPDLANLGADARKFKAPRSLRDIEPPVNLWVKSLDNVEVQAPPEDEPA